MHKVIEFALLGNSLILIKFEDGSTKKIDFSNFIGKGISKDLQDSDFFNKVEIESGGGLIWPNGFDFCPNFLYNDVQDETKIQDFVSNKQQ